MHLAELTGGQPFKAALRVLAFFLLVLALAGWALVEIVENTLVSELHAQNEGESLLLAEIYDVEGQAGVVDALQQMSRITDNSTRFMSLLDADGLTLTGPISIAPDFVRVARREVDSLTEGRVSGDFILSMHKLDNLTLVIGRNSAPIQRAELRLTFGLIGFGILNLIVTLAVGLWASRASMRRLQEMNVVLSRVSDGDVNVRIPVHGTGDQFDLVAERVNQNLDRLALLVTGMKTTASAIAHDLRTPLSHLQIALHEIYDSVAENRDPTPQIEAALAEAEALGIIFDTMLRISRIEAERDQTRLEPENLADIAQQVVDFVEPTAQERGQEIVSHLKAVVACSDASMLKQALVNLVVNASNHAGEGAQIEVAVDETPEDAVLTIRDTGPGIPAGDRDRVLKPFVRLDKARTTPGNGLGLTLVRAVAERHGGTITLSDAEPGLRVVLKIPKLKKS